MYLGVADGQMGGTRGLRVGFWSSTAERHSWACLLLATTTACSTTATISTMRDGSIDAEIVAGDHDNVYVQTDSGARRSIPRSEITDIDHPGDTATVLGAALSTYGVINIAIGWKQCQNRDDSQKAAYCAGVLAPLVVGVPLAVYGLVVHSASVNAADTPPGRASGHV